MNGEILPTGTLFLRTFGSSALIRRTGNDDEVLLDPSKLLALVVYLAFSPARTATRDGLIDLLWSELEPDAGRHALRQHLWQLKRRIGADLLVEGRDQLILKSPIDSDRAQFVAASERSDFRTAVELYTGDFFPGFAASGASEFERWVDVERADLRSRFVRCADVVVKEMLNSHHAKDAIALARRVRATEPLRQHGWRLLVEALLASGDVISAGVECDSLLRMAEEEELSLELATKSLVATVRRAGIPGRGPESRGTLAVELVGREREFSQLVDAWERARRRVTAVMRIEGPAGLGKTRLLTEFHARLDSMQARAVLVRANAGSTTVPFSLASDLAERLGALPGARAVSPQSLKILVALCPSLSSTFDAPPHTSSPADLPTHRLSALRELVAAIAAERPLAVLVDDLHWADHASRTLLEGLLGSMNDTAVLLCISSRQAAPAAGTASNVTTIVLGPLGESAVFSLLSSVASLPADSWADRLVETLHRLSHGIPLFIVEALRLALQEGCLEIRDGVWAAPDPDRLWRLFGSGEVLLRRISVLDHAELRLLRTLACAAHPLPEDVALRAGVETGMSGTAALGGLIQRGLVHASDSHVAIAHDEMGALVLQGTPAGEQKLIRHELGRALAQGDNSDPQRQRFAAAQLRATASGKELQDLFARYVSAARRRDDHRSARVLSTELLGDSASDEEIRSLARSLSFSARIRAFGLTRTAAIVGIGFGIVGSALGVSALTRDPGGRRTEIALQVRVRDSSGTMRIYQKVLLPNDTSADPIVIRRTDKPIFTSPVTLWSPVAQPGAPTRWLTVKDVPDTGQTEIFILEARRRERRLTFARGDDTNPAWSPDSRWIAFSTSRWDSDGHTDIAVMSANGEHVRQVTKGPSSDMDPSWSPDGTRLAFLRKHFSSDVYELCVATVDAVELVCRAHAYSTVLGWLNDSSIAVAKVDPAGTYSITVLGASDREVNSFLSLDAFAVAPNADFWIVRCSTAAPGELCVTSRMSPSRSRRIVVESGELGGADLIRLQPADYIDSIHVRNANTVARIGIPFGLDAIAWTVTGKPKTVRAPRIRSLDTMAVAVDSAGRLWGRRPGRALVEVSDAGWRTDTIAIAVALPADSVVMHERWESLERWQMFGEPLPQILAGERDDSALFVAGDGVYHSGVYSRIPVPWSGGITIRSRVSTPITNRQWQYLAIGLLSNQKPGRLPDWDSRTGYVWSSGRFDEACVLYVPVNSEGEKSRDSVSLASSGAIPTKAPRIVPSGDWYSLVVQFFPDGSCGAAVDGEVLTISPPHAVRSDSLYVTLHGNSVGTRILVGETTISLGVAKDIDWDRKKATKRNSK